MRYLPQMHVYSYLRLEKIGAEKRQTEPKKGIAKATKGKDTQPLEELLVQFVQHFISLKNECNIWNRSWATNDKFNRYPLVILNEQHSTIVDILFNLFPKSVSFFIRSEIN